MSTSDPDPYNVARSVLQKISCFLSFTGSFMIISSILRNKANRSKTQHRLLFAISSCDLITSLMWFFTDLFMPPRGNQNTCSAQGFFVQFGNTTNVFHMVALQIQYLLVVKYGWNDKKVRSIERLLHGIPVSYGLGTAIAAAAMNMYNPADWDCWIHPYPHDCESSFRIQNQHSDLDKTNCIRGDNAEIYQWAFFFIPLWAAIVFCLVVMFIIVRAVRKCEEKTHRYANPVVGDTDEGQVQQQELVLTKRAKKQGVLYAFAFFAVWTFPTISRLIELNHVVVPPILKVFSGCFIASQGLWNSIIYFRPKFNKLENKFWWGKLWALVKTELFFCFEGRCVDAGASGVVVNADNNNNNAG